MKIKKVTEHGKEVTRIFLEPGDEVSTNEETLRETAIYKAGNIFQLVESTDLVLPVDVQDGKGKEIIYLPITVDNSNLGKKVIPRKAWVDVPDNYVLINNNNNVLLFKVVEEIDTDLLKDWRQDVAEGKTELGFKDWKSLSE